MSDQELKDLFDSDVLDFIGGKDLLPEKKQDLYLEIAKTVQNRAIVRIYSLLSEEDATELDRLLETDDSAKVQEYLSSKGLDLTTVLTQEALAYKLEIYELFKMAKSQNKE